MNIQKRNGTIVEFNLDKISGAIHKAFLEVEPTCTMELAKEIAEAVENRFLTTTGKTILTVEEVQDLVEDELLSRNRLVAKRYIIYRNEKNGKRPNKKKYKFLSDEFLSKYKHRPDPLNNIGSFVFYRTYSRFLPEEGRREYWWETLARAVNYNCGLVPNTTVAEAEELYDNIYNLKQQLSGRTLFTGGTEASLKYPLSNFNCSFLVVEAIDNLCDLFYVLMVGTGGGVGIQEIYTEKLPSFRTDIKVFHEPWEKVDKEFREDVTTMEVNGDTLKIIIGDSKEGFMEALRIYLQAMSIHSYRTIKNIIVNYDYVRPAGERLVTFGGYASGYENMKNMLYKIYKVIQNKKVEKTTRVFLERIDVLDIINIIGENVVSGGVRRTAEIAFIDKTDKKSREAKNNLYYMDENGVWQENRALMHRTVSNNSIMYEAKPTREELHEHIQLMRNSGEPGIINAEAARKRRPNFKGLNPCAEVLMDRDSVCNLTTTNILAFVKNGVLDVIGLLRATWLSARAGYRMTNVTLELHNWDRIQKRDRLLGVSMTGFQDAMSIIGYTQEEQDNLKAMMRKTAHEAMKEIAKEVGGSESLLTTTVKPEGTLSWVMGGVSSGHHYQHAKFFIRRVRVSAKDPLVKVAEELGWSIKAETGQDWDTCDTKVIEFPIKSDAKKFKKDVTAIEQLEGYKSFQTYYTDHNTSTTVDVYDNEWDDVEEWLWNNWDEFVGVSFLSRDNNFYKLMPYEEITEEEYERLNAEMKPFNPILLRKYETSGVSELDLKESCKEDGACAVR